MIVSFKAAHFVKDMILTCMRWYVAYPLSYRQVEELMQERGVAVDHATINRWVLKYSPQLEEAFHRCKHPVWLSWRMDETYIRGRGQWRYLYRAVDKSGQTIDVLRTAQRDEPAATRFLTKAIRRGTAYPRRSLSTGARPMRPPSGGTTRSTARRSSFAK
jgi:putative transposase